MIILSRRLRKNGIPPFPIARQRFTFAPMIALEELYDHFRQHPQVCTDTRQLLPGCLYFALKGEHFDGNQFAEKALAAGAAFAVIDDPAVQINDRCLLVPDVLTALQQLARHHRRQFEIPVIAIGGSNGKTTTKELVSAVLSSHYPCHFTKGNLNNHIGVPLTLLAMPADTEVAVIEMGTNQPGDIAQLCGIAEPTHGLLTNIGKEHLEGFGNLAGVKKAEGELFTYLNKRQGCAFVNLSEKHLSAMAQNNRQRVAYMRTVSPPVSGLVIKVQALPGTPLLRALFLDERDRLVEIQTQLLGRHNFSNVMTAIALGIYFKVPSAKIQAAIEAYTPSNNRSQILRRNTTTILLDAYNANPSSMLPALEMLRDLPAGRKVAILGDMLELGAESPKEHLAIVRRAARLGFDALILVGPEFGKTPFDRFKARHFATTAAAKIWFDQQNFDQTTILIKGSRGIRLEQLLT